MTKKLQPTGSHKPRANGVDSHVGTQMRKRRREIRLTQWYVAEVLKITPQQIGKYEEGTNRVAAGRLYHIAKVLGVEVGYFFEDMPDDERLEAERIEAEVWGQE